MKWWNGQNLDQARPDKSGEKWNFRVWHGGSGGKYSVRMFFWDDAGEQTGVVLFLRSENTHISQLKTMIQKLVADPLLRKKYQREILFPLERHYSEYGTFPEEQ